MMISAGRLCSTALIAAVRAQGRVRSVALALAVSGAVLPFCGCVTVAVRANLSPGSAASRTAKAAQSVEVEEEQKALPGSLSGGSLTAIAGDPRREALLRLRRAAMGRGLTSAGGTADPGSWTQRGSSSQAGRTQVTVVSPDGQSLLVGTAGGSIFQGTPQAGWQPRGDSLELGIWSFGVRYLVVTPGPPQIWAAAGYFSPPEVSSDGGATWSVPTGAPQGTDVFGLLHDGGNPSTVYLFAAISDTQAQVFLSTDGGQTFTGQATLPLTSPPNTASGPGIWTSRTASGPIYVMLQNGQLMASSDHGATFSQLGAAGPGSTVSAVLGGSEAGGPTLYATLRQNVQTSPVWNLYASEDGGKTWQERFDTTGIFYSGNSGIGTSIHNPNLVLFGGIFAYRSTDGGRTFTQIGFDYADHPASQLHIDIDGIECAMWQGREALFVNTDGGSYVSFDSGATVQNITLQGFPDSQYYSSYTSPRNPDQIAAGAQDQGLQISHPGPGVMPFDQPYPGDSGHISSSAGDFTNLFVSGVGSIGFVADPAQEGPWTHVAMPPFTQRPFLPYLLADPEDAKSVYVGGDHIWRVPDVDQQPQPPAVMLPQDFSGSGGTDYVQSLAISAANGSYWYAITSAGTVWASHDHGVTWTSSQPASGLSGAAVLASSQDPLTCYAGGTGAQAAVYKSTDGGATWSDMSNGLPADSLEDLAFDGPATENVYAATDGGPYRYDSGAGTWVDLLTAAGGAPQTIYNSVEGVPAAGVVRFATFGRGIWDYSPSGSAQPPTPPAPPATPGHCTPGVNTLCLASGRFQVQAAWENQYNSTSGQASAITRTDDAGFFTFTDPTNVELIVKILDFGANFKVFYGELTDLLFSMTVTDVVTGTVKTYKNTPGNCGAIDEVGFTKSSRKRAGAAAGATISAATGEAGSAMPSAAAGARLAPLAAAAPGASGTCRPGSGTLCLMASRFALAIQWSNPGNGTSGTGGAVPLAGNLTGAFYFTDPADLELLVKVLDLGNRIAVFYGTLSDLEYTLTVTDTRSGQIKTYHNAAGNYCGGLDDTAFTP